MNSGFLLIDKPAGPTSHDVVADVRRVYSGRKVGHGGTLDPAATGLLVLGVGRATRLLQFIQELPKEYVATVQFGVATDTLDADGAILTREPMDFELDDLQRVLPRFVGRVMQVPPMVSALKVGGRRLYDLARSGQEVEREARPVDVYELDVDDFSPGSYPEAEIRVVCGRGTYVRTLADDVARALGGRAHLRALTRVRIGSLHVDDAVTVDQCRTAGPEADELLLSPAAGLRDLPAVSVDPATADGVRHGARFVRTVLGEPDPGPVRMLASDGRLLAVYQVDEHQARPQVVLS